MRVLLIKTSSMGDVIHMLPALTDALRARPEVRFDWVVEEGFAEIPRWHPAVEQVIPVALRRWRKAPLKAWRSGEWSALTKRLAEPYDLVIDAQGLLKSAWFTRYTQAPVAGFDRQSAREPIACRFYDRQYAVSKDQHALERLRQLMAEALGYPRPTSRADYGLDRQRLNIPQEPPYVVFLHGTTWASKHWPEPQWRALAERLNALGWAVRLPWGSEAEHQRAERIASGLAHVQALPKMNLSGVAGVIAGAKACVSVDTGLGHLAAALDVPNVSLYGPTLPGRIGAYGLGQVHLIAEGEHAGKGHREHPCFDRLGADQVWTALAPLLNNTERAE